MKKILFIVIIVIILAVLIVGGVYFWYITSKPAPRPPDQTEGWKTYTNEKYGFELKYPGSMTLGTVSEEPTSLDILTGETVIFAMSNRDLVNHISTQFTIFAVKDIEKCLETPTFFQNTSTSKVVINNMDFVKQKYSIPLSSENVDYYVIKNNQCYKFLNYVSYPLQNENAPPQDFSETIINIVEQEMNVLGKVMSTFKFTK